METPYAGYRKEGAYAASGLNELARNTLGPPVPQLDALAAHADRVLKDLCEIRSMAQTCAERLLGPEHEAGLGRPDGIPKAAGGGMIGEMGARIARFDEEVDLLRRVLTRIAKL